MSTTGAVIWETGPTNPEAARDLVVEAQNLTREIHAAQAARRAAEADAAMAALLAADEDDPRISQAEYIRDHPDDNDVPNRWEP